MSQIKRRRFLIVAGALLSAPLSCVLAQQPRHAVIGFLSTGTGWASLVSQSLRELGWIEGKNLAIEWRTAADGTQEKMRALASELARLRVDAIIAANNPAAEAVKRATRSIPIVVLVAVDPVGAGFAQSVARPGANMTGVLFADPAFSAKTLQLMKETLPGMRKVGWLYPKDYPGLEPFIAATELASQEMGVTIHRFPVTRPEGVEAVLAAAKREGVDAFRITMGGLIAVESRIREFIAANKIPDVYTFTPNVESGGFMSYAPKISDSAARGAALIDKILKGAKPAELPFEYPTRTELTVNLKAAKQLGITVPQSVLLRADRVIE